MDIFGAKQDFWPGADAFVVGGIVALGYCEDLEAAGYAEREAADLAITVTRMDELDLRKAREFLEGLLKAQIFSTA
ncbi:MAG: hypothetical protein M3Q70_01820 [bacterium]|nr:hypothetical protein [bacterium]